MKKASNFALLLAIGLAVLAPASAQSNSLLFSIPFPFLVGGQTMPAGDYVVKVDAAFRVLDIRSADGALAEHIAVASPSLNRAAKDNNHGFLRFTERAGRYALNAAWEQGAGDGFAVSLPKAEMETARNVNTTEIVSATR